MAAPSSNEIEFHFFSAPPTPSPPFGSPQLGFSAHSPSPSRSPRKGSPPRHRHQKRSTPSPFSSPLASTSSLPLPALLGAPAAASVGTATASSSRSRSRTPSVTRTSPQIGPQEPLIADVQLVSSGHWRPAHFGADTDRAQRKTRLVIRKTYDSLFIKTRATG